jgi:hypothetical protein
VRAAADGTSDIVYSSSDYDYSGLIA